MKTTCFVGYGHRLPSLLCCPFASVRAQTTVTPQCCFKLAAEFRARDPMTSRSEHVLHTCSCAKMALRTAVCRVVTSFRGASLRAWSKIPASTPPTRTVHYIDVAISPSAQILRPQPPIRALLYTTQGTEYPDSYTLRLCRFVHCVCLLRECSNTAAADGRRCRAEAREEIAG